MARHKRLIIAIALFVIIFVFLSLPLSISGAIKTKLANIFMPVIKGFSAFGRKLGQIWDAAVHSDSIVAENEKLKNKMNDLKIKNAIYEEKIRELTEFHEQFTKLEGSGFEILPAKVVGWEPEIWNNTVIINQGYKNGVTKGSLATQGDILIGRIIEVGPGWSRVRLLTDSKSVVPALIQKKGIRGIVVTPSINQLRIEYIDNTDEIAEGDIVITSEANHRYEDERIVFPQGLIIGSIKSIEPKEKGLFTAVIKPAADFRKITNIMVIVVK